VSVAFTKEGDHEAAAADLPDRPVSPHPNLVTASGLEAIERELAAARAAYAAAQLGGDVGVDRTAMARATRDLRYWSARRASAQLQPEPEDNEVVRLGSTVTLERHDGRTQRFRVVGEDEADPTAGRISYVSPLARAILGRGVGDAARLGGEAIAITAIE
jgi:transcription elongation GreA/GreB family factor